MRLLQRPRCRLDLPDQTGGVASTATHLRRCLDDDQLPRDLRITGALLLLFGHPIGRTVRLTAAHYRTVDDNHYLQLGRTPVLLPPSLAVLITEQLNQPAPTPLANTLETTTWMFPSPHPGTHRQAKGLYERLAALGITVRSGRRAVLMALAQDLPAGVLASLIGIHASTATAWSHELKRDWTAYLATRINPPNTANHDK